MSTDGVACWDGAQWIGMKGKTPNLAGAPMLRKEAPLKKPSHVREARLYVTALGVYEAYVNGRHVTVPQEGGTTTELLPPGWTNYDARLNRLTYDVTDPVTRQPDVTLAVVLGNGWYNGRISDGSTYYSEDGNTLALKAKLLIRYTDGTTQTVVTGPNAGWKATDSGPYRADDIYDGHQTYDARMELPGWTARGFDDSAWSDVERVAIEDKYPEVQLLAYPGETARLMPKWDRRPQAITVATGVTGQDGSSNGRGRIVVDPARTVTDPAQAASASVTIGSGETAVFDLGQNMVGVARYSLRGPAGAKVEFRFGEMLNDDSAGADGPEGSVYRANLRSARATSMYILKGDRHGETHQDSLTFYSARLMAQLARAIGRPAEGETYERLFGRIKQAFITKYLSTEGGTVTVRSSLGDASPIEPGADPNQKTEDNSQTALLWVLKLGFCETEAQRRTLVGLLADNIGNDAACKAGFKHFVLQPHIDPTGGITQVSGAYESPYGEVRSEWALDDEGRILVYEAVVPANSEATLRLPAVSADAVREGRTPLARVDGVGLLGHKDGVASYRLPSGRYHLTARLR